MSDCVCACGLRMEENCDCYGHGKPEREDEAAAELTRLRAELAEAQAERDEWRAEAKRIAAEARDCFEAQSEIDEAWNAIGTRGNRKALTLSEQVASLCRELDDGSFYKEGDIDRLMAERDAAQEREQRMREALEAANNRAARFVKLFGDHATAMAMLLHVSERASVFDEGAFRSGYEAAIEEAGAYLDSSDEDGRTTAQTLVEQVIGLMNGSYGLIEISAEDYEASQALHRAALGEPR